MKNMERVYAASALILAVIVLSEYTVASVIMLLIVSTPTFVFGSYLVKATYTRRNLLGSSAYIAPFIFGLGLILVSIKLLTVIYTII